MTKVALAARMIGSTHSSVRGDVPFMARVSSLYPTMIVRVLWTKSYRKVAKARVKVLQSPRQEDKFGTLEIVAFSSDEELFLKVSKLQKGMELIITGKREINTFNNKTIEQILLDKLAITSGEQLDSPASIDKLVNSF